MPLAVRKVGGKERRAAMEDKKIIELFFARSEQAIECVRERYGDLCRHIAANMLSDPGDVEECVSDTYLALWNAIPPARPEKLRPFVARIARNQAGNRHAYNTAIKRGRGMTVSLEELEPCLASSRDVEEELDGKELTLAIERFLLTLDADSRNVFLRRYWFYDSVEQIAAGMGATKSWVKTRLLRTRNKLRKHLIKEGFIYEP